jgi:hypothetical protein
MGEILVFKPATGDPSPAGTSTPSGAIIFFPGVRRGPMGDLRGAVKVGGQGNIAPKKRRRKPSQKGSSPGGIE